MNSKKIYIILWVCVGIFVSKFALEVIGAAFFGQNITVDTAIAGTASNASLDMITVLPIDNKPVQFDISQTDFKNEVSKEISLENCQELDVDQIEFTEKLFYVNDETGGNNASSYDSTAPIDDYSQSPGSTNSISNNSSPGSAGTSGGGSSLGLGGGSTSGSTGSSSIDSSSDDDENVPERLSTDDGDTVEEQMGGTFGSMGEDEPIQIWFFNVAEDTLESLEMALSSDVPNHANLYISNRWTGKLLQSQKYRDKLDAAIELCQGYNVKTILVRNLWPTYQVDDLDENILFDPDYYLREIELLRGEGQQYGTDYIGLDIEPYQESPVKGYFNWYVNYKPTENETQVLTEMVQEVLSEIGKVDFLYPAGSLRDYNFYNILSSFGVNRIAESTYYDNEDYQLISYPYEIFGIYLNINRFEDSQVSGPKPYYLVQDFFEKQDRWATKKGVFLYPRENKDLDVADALKNYRFAPE